MERNQKKYAYIDFEFNRVLEAKVSPVCSSFKFSDTGDTYSMWLHDDEYEQGMFAKALLEFHKEGYTFVSYSVEAEARSFISLGLRPTNFKWICLHIAYKALLNHDHKSMYGNQLINGYPKQTFAPKYNRSYDNKSSAQPEHGYAAACYALLGVKIDGERKKLLRDLIISAPKEFTETEQEEIMEYCDDDVLYLQAIHEKIEEKFRDNFAYATQHIKDIEMMFLSYGEYGARTALMQVHGYRVNKQKMMNLKNSISMIMRELQEDINSQFTDFKPFKKHKKTRAITWDQKATREWIQTTPYVKKWGRTSTNQLSLSLGSFEQFYASRHTYRTGCLGSQMVRYLKYKQHLGSFKDVDSKGKKKKNIWSYMGSDSCVRPYFNIYGSQSGRTQPSSTSFLFLKPAWLRTLMEPPKGYAYTEIDFSSQEFLVDALFNMDKNMLEAYYSGDVYLWWGKETGGIPQQATKKTHKDIRDKYKATTLATQYKMGAEGMAHKITADTGIQTSKAEAQKYINQFDKIFPDKKRGDVREQTRYSREKCTVMPDGWVMFGDNGNWRSVGNCPIQGRGASIMRRSVARAQDEHGLKVFMTLHDALFVLHKVEERDEAIQKLAKAMYDGFREIWPKDIQHLAKVRLDAHTWSKDYVQKVDNTFFSIKIDGELDVECLQQQVFVDDRAVEELEKFRPFMENEPLTF